MLYITNFDVPMSTSGIEHAIYRRIELFDEHNINYLLLLTDWNPNLYKNIQKFNLKAQNILNMYDYYQQTINVMTIKLNPKELDYGFVPSDIVENLENKKIYIKDDNQIVRAIVNLNEDNLIKEVEYYNLKNNKYAVHYYDVRGFKSSTKYYLNDELETQNWYNLNGQIVLRALKNKNDATTSYLLTNLNKQKYQIDGKKALVAHFFEEINNLTIQKNIFMIERPTEVDQAIKNLTKDTFKVLVIHNSHTNDANNPNDVSLNDNFKFGLHNAKSFSAIVSSTKKQSLEIKKRYPHFKYNYAIPVGYVNEVPKVTDRILMSDRKKAKIVVACRIADEKRLDHLINAINIVKEVVPEVTLDIYGKGSKAVQDKLNNLIDQLKLDDVVKFKGHTNDIKKAYQSGQLFTVTSTMEGFNISAMEALEQGVVGVTYDVNYGPNELIENEYNGYIVPFNDYNALANKIIDLLTNDELLQKMSDNAYDSTKRYVKDEVWQGFKKLIDDANVEGVL